MPKKKPEFTQNGDYIDVIVGGKHVATMNPATNSMVIHEAASIHNDLVKKMSRALDDAVRKITRGKRARLIQP